MFVRTLSEIEEQLMKVKPGNIGEFFETNTGEFLNDDRDFSRYMNEVMKEKKLLKQDVLLKADIPQKYGYKLLSMEKVTRQRDVIIRICYAAELSLCETQKALLIYGMSMLYARNKRDALLMACFNKRPGSIIDVNEHLMKNKMAPLKSSGVQD